VAKLMISTNGTIHLTANRQTQSCGMGRRQRYLLTEIAADFDWGKYTPETHGFLFCLKCQHLHGWAEAYLAALQTDAVARAERAHKTPGRAS
jgi:hypothetical protein